MTLDDLEGSLCALFQNTGVLRSSLWKFEWRYLDLYCQRQKFSLMTLVSANIRFVPIFKGFIGERASNDRGVIENMDLYGFRRYVFGTLRNETNVIVYYYLIPCRLFTDPEIYDLGWLWMAWMFIVPAPENVKVISFQFRIHSAFASFNWSKNWYEAGVTKEFRWKMLRNVI